jgi:hypothetical protein
MPTLEKTDGGLPPSALRYRPTADDTITVDEYLTSANTPVLQVRRASRFRQPEAINEEGIQEGARAKRGIQQL